MTVVIRDQQTPMGVMRVVQVERTHFNCLLRAQRLSPVRYQWAGSRFRRWRQDVNNASRAAADYAECHAWLEAGGNEQTRKGSPHPFAIIDGGRADDHVTHGRPPEADWAREARARWRETDGFARIDGRNPYEV